MTFSQSARNNIRTIYSYTSTASLPVGVYWAYSDGKVPQDAAGAYQNIETVVIGGARTDRTGSFSVSGGRTCMFHASQGALEVKVPLDVGHAGWAVKRGPTLDSWEFGSTENPVDVWTRTGTWSDVIGAFRHPPAAPARVASHEQLR